MRDSQAEGNTDKSLNVSLALFFVSTDLPFEFLPGPSLPLLFYLADYFFL